MTVYNGEKFLRETLDAVIAQTLSDWEMVIVNNCSTDCTQDILNNFDDPRIHVVYPTGHGTFGDGIRLAYENAKGDYIAVQDGDDISFPTRFEHQVAVLEADEKLGLISGWFKRIDQYGNILGESSPPTSQQELIDTYQTSNPLAHSTYMFRRQAAIEIGGYPTEYELGPDFGLAIRLIKGGWNISILPEFVLKLREHIGQTSSAPSQSVTRAHDALFLFKEAAGLPNISAKAKILGKRNLSKQYIQYSLILLNKRFVLKGLKQIIYAFANHPLYSLVYLGYRLLKMLGIPVKSGNLK